jgi:GIY-YIG catalytic domain
MDLNDLLRGSDIDPREVLVLRHRPTEPKFRKVFPWLAVQEAGTFNAYQQTQDVKVENAMQKAKYVASFIGHEPARGLFIGLYKVCGSEQLTHAEYWSHPAKVRLRELGHSGYTEEQRTSILWFDLDLTDFYSRWKGKLIIEWPGTDRSWWRWASKNIMSVQAILEDSALEPAVPAWEEINLTWEELSVLPNRWRTALSFWRGIYYIFDTSDAKGYVGSAYGQDNLLARWQTYASGGDGGNRELRGRDPRNFRFTILQRVSPDMPIEDITKLESSWKQRLHTRLPYGLNAN